MAARWCKREREREERRGERWVVVGGKWMVVVSESEDESESKFSVREFSVKQLFRKLTCRMVTHGDPSDKPYRACSAPLAPPIPPRAESFTLPSTSSPLYSACSHRTLHSPGSRLLARTHQRRPEREGHRAECEWVSNDHVNPGCLSTT